LPGTRPIPEVVATLRALPAGAPVAVASGGLRAIVRETLGCIGLELGPGGQVQVMVCSDDVPRGKPHPDMFLRSAELLGVPAKRCLVFEDAIPGFEAAAAAGMDYIDVRPHRADLR
jgi:HAD superfamily hydrolase (TIGR01509 family)